MTCRDVLLLGSRAFENLAKSIKIKIGNHGISAERYKEQILKLQEKIAGLSKRAAGEKGEDEVEEASGELKEATKELEKTKSLLGEVTEPMEDLEKFHEDVTGKWSHPNQRILGHIVRSPPITLGAGTEGFTEDYAVVELDTSKFKKSFVGTAIDLGTS